MTSAYYVAPGWWYSLIFVLVLYAIIEWWHIKHDHAIRLREATIWTIIYVSAGLLYAVPIFVIIGSQAGGEYLGAFLTEKALSLDNLFIFGLIFASFKVPKDLERRILNYGVVGAIVFRLVFILGGIALLERFEWISVVFGLILLRAAWHAFEEARGQTREDEEDEKRLWRFLTKLLPISQEYEGHKLVTHVNGKRVLTMLAGVILLIELTDILFAVDSIPAVLAISSSRFIAYSSNVFAILGMRALYFVYADIADKFWALKWAIAAILGWISIKLILAPFGIHMPQLLNLGILLGLIMFTIILSVAVPPPPKRN